jgi:hypothetical protein
VAFSAGDVPTAAQLDGLALRYVTHTTNNSSNVTATTTETAGTTCTWTSGSTSDRYLLLSSGAFESSVLGDLVVLRVRYKAGAALSSPPSADTLLTAKQLSAVRASSPIPFMLIETLTGISGQYTAGTTIIRSAGTGTVQIVGAATTYSNTWVFRLA